MQSCMDLGLAKAPETVAGDRWAGDLALGDVAPHLGLIHRLHREKPSIGEGIQIIGIAEIVRANKAIFDKNGITEPTSWEELIANAQRRKAAGVIPIAMSDESWQIEEIWESMVADVNGQDFYKKSHD